MVQSKGDVGMFLGALTGEGINLSLRDECKGAVCVCVCSVPMYIDSRIQLPEVQKPPGEC